MAGCMRGERSEHSCVVWSSCVSHGSIPDSCSPEGMAPSSLGTCTRPRPGSSGVPEQLREHATVWGQGTPGSLHPGLTEWHKAQAATPQPGLCSESWGWEVLGQ